MLRSSLKTKKQNARNHAKKITFDVVVIAGLGDSLKDFKDTTKQTEACKEILFESPPQFESALRAASLTYGINLINLSELDNLIDTSRAPIRVKEGGSGRRTIIDNTSIPIRLLEYTITKKLSTDVTSAPEQELVKNIMLNRVASLFNIKDMRTYREKKQAGAEVNKEHNPAKFGQMEIYTLLSKTQLYPSSAGYCYSTALKQLGYEIPEKIQKHVGPSMPYAMLEEIAKSLKIPFVSQVAKIPNEFGDLFKHPYGLWCFKSKSQGGVLEGHVVAFDNGHHSPSLTPKQIKNEISLAYNATVHLVTTLTQNYYLGSTPEDWSV